MGYEVIIWGKMHSERRFLVIFLLLFKFGDGSGCISGRVEVVVG